MVVDTVVYSGTFLTPYFFFSSTWCAPFSLNYYAYRQTATSYHHPVCVLGDTDTCSSVPEFKARIYVNLTNGHTDALYAMSFVDLFVLINKGRRRRRTKSEIMSLCRATTHLLEHRKWTNNSDLLDFEEVCVTIPLCTYVHKVPRAEFIIERRFQSTKGCARTTFVFHLSVSDVEIIDKWLEAIKWWITI